MTGNLVYGSDLYMVESWDVVGVTYYGNEDGKAMIMYHGGWHDLIAVDPARLFSTWEEANAASKG